MAFSGLRFADLQRINLRSLVLSPTDVRGLCWRSKTQTHGHPFGLITSGFLSKGPHNWLWRFLMVLDITLTKHQPSDPDFLLPDCSDTAVNPAYIPMSYAKALSFLRAWIHAPWQSGLSPLHDLELNYTIHGLKAHFSPGGHSSTARYPTINGFSKDIRILDNPSVCTDVTRFGGPWHFRNRWCLRRSKDSALKLPSIEEVRHPSRNPKSLSSILKKIFHFSSSIGSILTLRPRPHRRLRSTRS